MQRPLPTDDWIVSVLRDVETPMPPARLFKFRRRAVRLWRWLAPAGLVSAGAALVIALTLQPAPSLGQVIAALKRVDRYTIVNTRFLTDGHQGRSVLFRDGSRWSNVLLDAKGKPLTRTVMDGKTTLSVYNYSWFQNEALIDEPSPMREQSFDIKRFLREGKPFKQTRVIWRGRTVDRFEAHSTYPGIKRAETYDQVVYADPQTHLPIHDEV